MSVQRKSSKLLKRPFTVTQRRSPGHVKESLYAAIVDFVICADGHCGLWCQRPKPDLHEFFGLSPSTAGSEYAVVELVQRIAIDRAIFVTAYPSVALNDLHKRPH